MSWAGPRRLVPVLQDYAWGSTTAIARLRGVEPTGRPEAELWFGAHPKAPATVDGTGLDTMITEHPDLVGSASVDAFGARLPYLLKILAAARPLSLQAHPSRAQAEAGYAREEAADAPAAERNYADDWPKPEMLVALEPTEALCGFRDPSASADLLDRLGVDDLTTSISSLRDADPVAATRNTFLAFLARDDHDLLDQVIAAAHGCDDGGELGRWCATAIELAAENPGDPGVLAALLMNRISLQPHQGVFLPAGNLHAYLSGIGVEIMASSDNVLRGGLTSKRVDVDELGAVLDFRPGFPGIVEAVQASAGLWRYETPAPEFVLWRLSGAGVELPEADTGRIVLAIDPLTLSTGDGDLALGRGDAAFVPAGSISRADCAGVAFVAGPGLP